ncbi:unnamed protein product [Rotaria magnacalcarata]|uniref:Chitinase n=1 Tax=Rotaria magnacalcarata TaxID=392030 RepID=A0A816MCZ8_9BILA|nr:unnamed protein product [Rotaria magnacalcarata]CAF3788181.1 unnamed protein product [Rotaria magnacalcarata]
MRQYYSLVYHLTLILLIIIVGQANDVSANKINLKQSYCRDLRDCQTYFPCAVFSSGFSYLYVIKRCANEQIFDEEKQKCVKNTLTDPSCVKQTNVVKPRLTTIRPSSFKQIKRTNITTRRPIKIPFRTPPKSLVQRKNFDFDHGDEQDSREEKVEQLTTETSRMPIRQINDNPKIHRVCYITNWSRYRSGEAKFEIEYIDPFMCSHIIYAYATVDDNKPEIKPVQQDDIEHYRELALLKKTNPDLKLSIRLGGKSSQFTRYLKSSKMTAQLVRSLSWFMASYGFDGVDIAFEFPDEEVPEDKFALTALLEEISKQKRMMTNAIVTLTAAPFVGHLLKVYDVQKIEKLVNYFNLMTFDFYGPWDEKTGAFAPLYQQVYQVESESLRNVDGLVKLWLSLGVPREKLLIGIPAYGRSFTLASRQKGLHAPVSGPGYPGRYTKTRGFLSYYEICEKEHSRSWQKVWLDTEKSWYMTSGDQWISYEDIDSATLKAQYAKGEQLAGVFIWSVDNDEFSGFFCNTEPFPITRQVFATLNLPIPVTSAPAIAIQSRLPAAGPSVRFVNVQSQSQSSLSSPILPPNLQKLLNALSALSGTPNDVHMHEATLPAPPPPIAHLTHNAEYICSRHRMGRNGIHRDRKNCSIFYFCEGDDTGSLRYHIFFCPPGLEFSMDGCTCDWPTGHSCQTGGDTFCVTQPVITTTTTTTTTKRAPYIAQSSMNALSGLGQLLGISGGTTSAFDCTGRRTGLYRDMYDCTIFYFCTTNDQTSHGTLLRYDFICPTNYAFSMSTCRCERRHTNECRTLTKTDCLLL